MQYIKALLLAKAKEVRHDGAIVEVVIWQLPQPVSPCSHCYKYRLYFGQGGRDRVRYDSVAMATTSTAVGWTLPTGSPHSANCWRALNATCSTGVENMKAIIEVGRAAAIFATVRAQLTASGRGQAPDFRLGFESARALFAELTPARMDLLDTLRRSGPSSVYALAKAAERNYSNVHTDVVRLVDLGLMDRADGGAVSVPFESVEIHFPLAQQA